MGRPAKAVNTMSKHLSKAEMEERKENENYLKGKSDKIRPPTYLSASQKKIFRYIVKELEASEILGNLDIYILSTCSIAIDRLKEIETMINGDSKLLLSKELMSAKDKYTKDLDRCCSELSLSPQSRAKLANINVTAQKDKADPLLEALKND